MEQQKQLLLNVAQMNLVNIVLSPGIDVVVLSILLRLYKVLLVALNFITGYFVLFPKVILLKFKMQF